VPFGATSLEEDIDSRRHSMPTSSTLDSLIRSTVVELVESAPQAPALLELELESAPRVTRRRRWDLPHDNRRGPILFSGVVLVVSAGVAALLVLPNNEQHRPPPKMQRITAAVTAFHEIALKAVQQPVPQLSNGQYLLTREQVTFAANIGQVGNVPTPGAQATVTATVSEWSNNEDESCIESTSGPATFASPANQAAWLKAGLLVNPRNPTSTSCVDSRSGAFDVSNLPTDPSVLATELNNGTTDIPAIDQQIVGPNGGFNRAVILLIGPTVGGSPEFTATLFNALAQISGVTDLGHVKTSNGAIGIGFSVSSAPTPSVIIIDPSTGALLEAKNIPDQNAFSGFGGSYLPPSLPAAGGIGYSISIQQFDPIGTPTIAPLPPGLNPGPPEIPVGTIFATTKVGVSVSQILQIQTEGPCDVAGGTGPSPNPGSIILNFQFDETRSQVNACETLLNSSGLFSSVVFKPST
jgi:hypothetical protein